MKRVGLTIALLLAGCFNVDERPCTFACGPGGACPDDYTCLGDGYCHLHGQPGACAYSDLAMNLSEMSPMPDIAMNADVGMQQDLAMPDLATQDLAVPVDLAMNSDLTPPADLLPLTLTVNVTGGIGNVTSTPSGINCSSGSASGCSSMFPSGQSMQLDTTGLKLWGTGPCSSFNNTTPCTFTLNASQSQDVAFYSAGRFPATARASAADTAALNPSSITVEAWLVMTSTSEASSNVHVAAISKGTPFGGTSTGYQLGYLWDGTNFFGEFVVSAGGTLFGCDGLTSAITAGRHHLAGEYDATSGALSLFVDGTQACTGTGTAATNLTPATGSALVFGAPSGDPNPFNGTIDDVRIMNAAVYSGTMTMPFPPRRHPGVNGFTVGLWTFDEGTGTTIADSSPTGANATVAGSGFAWVAEP